MSRAVFLAGNPQASAWATLDRATDQQQLTTSGAVRLSKGRYEGKTAVILGSGVAGLTTAYELLAQRSGMRVIVLEAHGRTGGRCLSLRTGDTLTEDSGSELSGSPPGQTQVVRFERPVGDGEPYLNAGPGRIPSSHKRLLTYLRNFGVEVEVYVMSSGANLVQMKDGPLGGDPFAYRRLDHNTRGWLAEMIYARADELVPARAAQLRSLMISFGELDAEGRYGETAGQPGMENARSRAGFTELPGVPAGLVADPLSLDTLLGSEFWERTRFYQPADFLWQPTLFQPVGGMDRVQHAFAQQVAAEGGTIRLSSPVTHIAWNEDRKQFAVSVGRIGTTEPEMVYADFCFSNIAMPFLRDILSPRLQDPGEHSGFEGPFKEALGAVYKAQFQPSGDPKPSGYVERFLACTTKVGWQANRDLWQGRGPRTVHDPHIEEDVTKIDESEIGVVPIYGGISWTDDPITQIWYPSTRYHDKKGVLTGAYNFSERAFVGGKDPVAKRLEDARRGAALFDERLAEGLEHGLAIAWQNMPYIKGGWAQWHAVSQDAVRHFNALTQGTCVDGDAEGAKFFIVGDQVSSLPGWQEGAIASALNALTRLANWEVSVPHLASLPDTRLMVEGV